MDPLSKLMMYKLQTTVKESLDLILLLNFWNYFLVFTRLAVTDRFNAP